MKHTLQHAYAGIKPVYWATQALGWICITLFMVLHSGTYRDIRDGADGKELASLSFWVLSGVLSTHLMRMAILRLRLLDRSPVVQISGILALTALFAIAHSVAVGHSILYVGDFRMPAEMTIDIETWLVRSTLNILVVFLAWNTLYFLFHCMSRSKSLSDDSLSMVAAIRKMELRSIM